MLTRRGFGYVRRWRLIYHALALVELLPMSNEPLPRSSRDFVRKEPIDRVMGPLEHFLHIQAASGVVLLFCTVIALVAANSPWAHAYHEFWETEIGFSVGRFELHHSLHHWINDGLMVIFFFVVGLEIKREFVLGHLSEFRAATLPIAAALGGMVAPAGIYLLLQANQPGRDGWGVPMATDIAFVVGCLALLGSRVPPGLRVLLLALAIVDDIGAILVIAVGYSSELAWGWLIAGFVGILIVSVLARFGIRSFAIYLLVGMMVWLEFEFSGVHATIAGVILGLQTPARAYVSQGVLADLLDRANLAVTGDWDGEPHRAEKVRGLQWVVRESIPPVEYLESLLHPWVGFVIMPLFALANAGVKIDIAAATSPIAVAIVAGLVLGKPLGIGVASYVAVKLGLARLPDRMNWSILVAGGFLAGIGFTMALFIASLAFSGEMLDQAKVGVLVGSVLSAIFGMSALLYLLPRSSED